MNVDIVRTVRRAMGDQVGLAVDSNWAYDDGAAVALGKRLEEFNLLWWEEPIWADDLNGHDELRRMLRIPCACGETMSSDWLLRNNVQPQRVAIVQPDLDTVGLNGGRRISYLWALNGLRLCHTSGARAYGPPTNCTGWPAFQPLMAGRPPSSSTRPPISESGDPPKDCD